MQTVRNVFYTAAIIAAIPLAIVAAPIVAIVHIGVHLVAWRRGNAPASWPSFGSRRAADGASVRGPARPGAPGPSMPAGRGRVRRASFGERILSEA